MNLLRNIEENFEAWIMEALVIGIGVVMMLQVFMRYVLNSPLPWAEEACRYMFVWITFMSMGFCFRNDILLRVDLLYAKVNKKIKVIIDSVSIVLTFSLFSVFFLRSINIVNQIAATNQVSAAMRIPMVYVYSASTVGFLLAIIRYLQFLIRKYVTKTLYDKDRLDTTTN